MLLHRHVFAQWLILGPNVPFGDVLHIVSYQNPVQSNWLDLNVRSSNVLYLSIFFYFVHYFGSYRIPGMTHLMREVRKILF